VSKRKASSKPASARKGRGGADTDAQSPLLVMGHDFTWALDERRLNRIKWNVQDNESLDYQTQTELLHMLEVLRYIVPAMTKPPKPRRGTKPNPYMRILIGAVHALHTEHDITVAAAIRAIIDDDFGTEEECDKMRENVKKSYTNAVRTGADLFANQVVVSNALGRIKRQKKGSN